MHSAPFYKMKTHIMGFAKPQEELPYVLAGKRAWQEPVPKVSWVQIPLTFLLPAERCEGRVIVQLCLYGLVGLLTNSMT